MKLPIFNIAATNRVSEGPGAPSSLPTPAGDRDRHDPQRLRDRLLNRLMAASGLAIGMVALERVLRIQRTTDWHLTELAGAAAVILLTAGLIGKPAYRLRVSMLLGFLFLTGAAVLVSDGLSGSGRIFLITLPWFAALLTGHRNRLFWSIAALGVPIILFFTILSGWIPGVEIEPNAAFGSPFAWLTASAIFLLLASAGIFSTESLLRYIENALERSQSLAAGLEADRDRLSKTIEDRSQDLERRLVQIHTAADITRAISRTLDIDRLLPQVCEMICMRFDLYYVGIFLVEETRPGDSGPSFAVLKAGSGEAGQKMLAERHRLEIGGSSMIGWAIETQQPRIALDVGAEAVRFNNPHLPLTRSELALPILTSKAAPDSLNIGEAAVDTRPLGAISIQSIRESAFDQDDIVVLQSIADALAAVIENARLFAAMQSGLEEVQALHRQYLRGAWQRAGSIEELSYQFGGDPITGESADLLSLEVPLRVRGQVIGSLVLEPDPEEAASGWKSDEVALAQTIADQAALALENVRLLEESQRTAELQRKSAGIAGKLWSSPNIEAILRTTLQELSASLGAREGWIELRSPDLTHTQGAAADQDYSNTRAGEASSDGH